MMFETTSELSIQDNKSERPPLTTEQFSLPLIPQKPLSRGEGAPQRKFNKKQKIALPNIKDDEPLPPQDNREESDPNMGKNDEEGVLKNKSTFARQVQEKLKLVLGGMQEEEQPQPEESDDSEDFDFQAKVNANKELIRMHRLKNQHQNSTNQVPDKQSAHPPRPKKMKKPRNESLYERRVKQYKDQSIENKYLQKRKQTIKQKSNSPANPRQSLKQIKPKDYISLKQGKKVPQSSKKIPSSQSSKKNINETEKSINLFDGIQNYLENPKNGQDGKKPNNQVLTGLSLLKAKRDIEDKIKLINQKLSGQAAEGENRQANDLQDKIPQQTVKEWRRVQIKEKKIDVEESNFDKQLERINSLQERSSLSLEKYLDHQKILLELELRNRNLVRQTNTH